MIVTDLDGTLLRTDKTISSRTQEVLQKCREAGIKVVYATGRGGSADRVAHAELFDGRITMNGAVAKMGVTNQDNITVAKMNGTAKQASTVTTSKGNDIAAINTTTKATHGETYKCLIPYKTARPILVACDMRGIKITSEVGGMHYSNFAVSDFWPQLTNFEITDFSRHALDAEKIYSPNPNAEESAFIRQLLPTELYSVATSDITGVLLQVMHKDATKWKTVLKLANRWGIQPSEIVAFGDDLNDLDMLENAGIGVAMHNALDEVKAVCNTVCGSNNEDGLAGWITNNVAML